MLRHDALTFVYKLVETFHEILYTVFTKKRTRSLRYAISIS
jgi:hypothetical protein